MKDKPTNYWLEKTESLHEFNKPGTILYWANTDTEENFLKNGNRKFQNEIIIYRYNNHGFRTHEFDFTNTDNNILCFGCSETEGIGVQESWPVFLERKLKEYKIYNLGHAGSSADTVARLATNYITLLKPKKIFILWPRSVRFELYNSGIRHIGPWTNISDKRFYVEIYSEQNVINWFQKNLNYVKYMCKYFNIELYGIGISDVSRLDYARDNKHYGPITHEKISEQFLTLLNCKI